MVIVVIGGIQHSQRQPFECRQPLALREVCPKKLAPFDVVITVPIAAADSLCAKLQESHHHDNGEKPENEINNTRRRLGLEVLPPRETSFLRYRCRSALR